MKVRTETGSLYEIDRSKGLVRRLEVTHDLRRDGEWLRFSNKVSPTVGQPLLFTLEPLGEGDVTVRETSRVVEVVA